ncbi:MAG: acyltransferase [Epsilonproteobacteria bacterium (ex Lamellibrachia satsuma)]|nr:MAG: acyltransferase [Epsilonproteobacteria bacterium (ex Lamellibrachia satsuma)]
MSKILNFRRYFSTFVLTRGFLIALLGSAFIYLDHWGFSYPLINTILGLASLYLLLQENRKVWFFSGFFIGLFWFWWIGLSFMHYNMIWAIPFVIFFVALIYGILFWIIAWIAEFVGMRTTQPANGAKVPAPKTKSVAQQRIQSLFTLHSSLFTLILKALGLLGLSYIHPFGFDWFKPELIFIESYLGIEKWQFCIILFAIVLSIWKKQFLYLFFIILAYQPVATSIPNIPSDIQIVTTHTSVEDKWNKTLHKKQFDLLFKTIDRAIDTNKTLIILPESVFPVFLKHSQMLMKKLLQKAKKTSIVTGGLYWDGKTPRNSTYIFTNNKVNIANKVVLVPFGESNPLPDFLSNWVNKVFYDGAVDYKASKKITDYKINGVSYRNAICFEATSEKLYEGRPKNMIVLSNNGWFIPSIEPTLQKLLLQYYNKKYGTTIYHSVNMAESYIIMNGIVRIQK